MTVIDCTSSPPNWILNGFGVQGVMRYLGPPSLSKVIRPQEFERLRSGGFAIGLVHENYAQDWLRGTARQDAKLAVSQAKQLGYPEQAVIYTACDLDLTALEWTADTGGKNYAAIFRDIVNDYGYQAGVYGPWYALDWCSDELGYRFLWQSMSTAWSRGSNRNRYPSACLWQRRSGQIGNISVDYNDQYAPFGGCLKEGTDMSVVLSDTDKHYIASATACLVTFGNDDRGYVDQNDIPWDSDIAKWDNRSIEERQKLLFQEVMDRLDGIERSLPDPETVATWKRIDASLAALVKYLTNG